MQPARHLCQSLVFARALGEKLLGVWSVGFEARGLGLGVWCLGLGVLGLGFGV